MEEYGIQDGKRLDFDWYYSDDKPLYYTMKTGKGAARADLLLSMSKEFIKQVQLKPR